MEVQQVDDTRQNVSYDLPRMLVCPYRRPWIIGRQTVLKMAMRSVGVVTPAMSITGKKPMLPEYARSSRLDYQERDQRVRLK
jgi:hypothetical protein